MTSRDSSSSPAVALAEVADAPQWSPSTAELDDIELALAGVDLPVVVQVPADVAQSLKAAPRLALTDPEGTPLALLQVRERSAGSVDQVQVTGSVVAVQPAEHGPFRRLRTSSAAVRTSSTAEQRTSPLVVLVDQPLQEAHVNAISKAADSNPIVFLVLAGHGSPQLVDAATLIRITLLAAQSLTGATVVVVPLARRADPSTEQSRRAAVLEAYAGDNPSVLALDSVADALPVEVVRAVLDAGQQLTAETFAAPVEALVEQSHRRPDEQGLTVLFTGLSGSGKSTLARAFAEAVNERFSRTVTLLDGDVVRRMLSAGLTFSKADRELNITRIGFVAAEINRHGGLAVCCPIAPYASTRADVRAMVEAVGSFVLVHVSTPLAECERRDRKGLYAKARAGLIPEFTGISDPYEEPTDADLVIDTTGVSVTDGVEQVISLLIKRGNLVAAVAVGRTPPGAISAGTAGA